MPRGYQFWLPKFWLPNLVLYQTDKALVSVSRHPSIYHLLGIIICVVYLVSGCNTNGSFTFLIHITRGSIYWVAGSKNMAGYRVFTSLWPSDAIWRQGSGSTLAQVMACCLTAPSHHLNQCWLIISKIQLHQSDGNFSRDKSVTND